MGAVFGKPDGTPGAFDKILMIEPLAEVDVIRALDGGGYEIRYLQRDQMTLRGQHRNQVTADKVIVSAGCLGTSEILLRSKAKGRCQVLVTDGLWLLTATRSHLYETSGRDNYFVRSN